MKLFGDGSGGIGGMDEGRGRDGGIPLVGRR
jgi:hypothetical protein